MDAREVLYGLAGRRLCSVLPNPDQSPRLRTERHSSILGYCQFTDGSHSAAWEKGKFWGAEHDDWKVFRWLALWKLGGFWWSIQIRPLSSLDPLREHSLVLAEQKQMSAAEFETLHRLPLPAGLPPGALMRLTDGGFAAEAGHWFVSRVLDLLIERAGYLDSAEPKPDEEEYTTGAGVLNAAWLACLADGLPVAEAVLPAPVPGSASRPAALELERAEEPSGFGVYGYRHTDLN